MQSQPITEMEYFFDNDPGVGNGTPLTITPGDTLDFNISGITTASLSPGFHTFFLRARDNAGQWAVYVGRSFYLQPAANTAPAPSLTEIEYFYDNDPGVGNGISLVVSTADTIDAMFTGIPTTGLSSGFHTLFVRSRGADGTWGTYIGRTIFVQPQATVQPQAPISQAEYFFDADPGVGNGTPINFTASDTVDMILPAMSTTGLGSGFHTVFLRLFDTDGVAGVYQGRTFYLQEEANLDTVPLIGMEYLYDTDTGGGTGTYLALNPTMDLDTIIAAPVGNLSFGMHDLFVRVVDSAGNWSHVAIDSFMVGNCSSFFPAVVASDSLTFCEGDSVQLSVTQAYNSYQWSNGATGNTITVSQSGNYSVTVTDSTGCQGSSIPITVSVLSGPQPMIQSNAAFSFCAGDSIMLSTGQTYSSYLWSTGETTPAIFVSQSGAYSVMVFDGNGCEGNSEPITTEEIPIPEPPFITDLGNDSLYATGIGEYFLWYVNDSLIIGQNDRRLDAPLSGTYRVKIVVNGCASELSEPFELWLTNTAFLPEIKGISVYPNPFHSQIHIELQNPAIQQLDVRIFDMLGKEWFKRKNLNVENGKTTLEVRDLPSGIYIVQVIDTESERESFLRMIKSDD